MNFQEELKEVEFAMKSAVGGGLRLERWLFLAASLPSCLAASNTDFASLHLGI